MKQSKSLTDFSENLESAEAAVRTGQTGKAAKLLSEVSSQSLPRELRLPYAQLCRRIGRIQLGLKILTPNVKGPRGESRGSTADLAEYGALLNRYGAIKEAKVLLEKLDPKENPAVLLYRAFCLVSQWDYEASVPLLEEYAASVRDPYQQLIAKVNLGAALISVRRFDDGWKMLGDLAKEARERRYSRLEANAQELLASIAIERDDLGEATHRLRLFDNLLDESDSIDRLLADKWRAVIEAKKANSIEPLVAFRSRAASWPHPESVRETDLQTARISGESELIKRLFFGTPHPAYRERICHLTRWSPQENHFLFTSEKELKAHQIFDLQTGLLGEVTTLAPQSLILKLFRALASDSYRPARLGTLFGAVFPQEHFNVFSSPARVHQLIKRARQWSKIQNLGLIILPSRNGYALSLSGQTALRIALAQHTHDPDLQRLIELEKKFGARGSFSASEAKTALSLSSSSLQRLLQRLTEKAVIDRFGAGLATRYYFAKKPSAA